MHASNKIKGGLQAFSSQVFGNLCRTSFAGSEQNSRQHLKQLIDCMIETCCPSWHLSAVCWPCAQTLVVALMLAAVVGLFTLKTLHRNTEWQDEETLFIAAQDVSVPDSRTLRLAGRLQDACMSCHSTSTRQPMVPGVQQWVQPQCTMLGIPLHYMQQRLAIAAPLPRCAAQVCGLSAKVQLNSGILERRYKRWDAAIKRFQLAKEIDETYCEPDYHLGATMVQAGM